MQLTRFTDYSLRVLLYSARHPDRLCTIDEIAGKFSISKNHLVKVVHKLSQLGLITSFRGKKGGIRLAKKPDEYRIGDIVKAIEPDMNLLECFDSQANTCPIAGNCCAEDIIRKGFRAFIDTLNEQTLEEMMRSHRASRFFYSNERGSK